MNFGMSSNRHTVESSTTTNSNTGNTSSRPHPLILQRVQQQLLIQPQQQINVAATINGPGPGERGSSGGVTPSSQAAPSREEIDSFLAWSMTQISATERQLALEDLHGLRMTPAEQPESVSIWLAVLDIHLNSIKMGTIYEVAERMDKSYITSQEFRMLFLRSEQYDPEAAAKKIIKFLEVKKDLFGQEKLVKKITLQDLDDDDLMCLKSGGVQVLPFPDSTGRKIVAAFPCLRQYKTVESEMRARYYFVMSLLEESDETQKAGVVAVWYAVSPVREARSQYGGNTGLLYALPLHFASIHFCSTNVFAYILTSAGFYLCPPKIRARIRIHWGGHKKCLEELSTFGIPKDGFPMSPPLYEPTNENQVSWVKERYRYENSLYTGSLHTGGSAAASDPAATPPPKRTTTTITTSKIGNGNQPPSELDVVFGRGRSIQDYPGNKKFRAILDKKKNEYDNLSKFGRTDLAASIIQQIKNDGGRFLKKKDSGGEACWEEVELKEARAKVTMAFRSRRKLAKIKAINPQAAADASNN